MSKYVPMNDAFLDKTTDWVYATLSLDQEAISRRGIVVWCEENVEGRWTMLGGSKFGFEDGGDAMSFKLYFGL